MSIPWREWDKGLFRDPTIADQLRVLVISPSWNVRFTELLETTFTDARVVRYLNDDVTPIQVDLEDRPDVALRYAENEQVTVALLTPDGSLLAKILEPSPEKLLVALDLWISRWGAERDEVLAELEAEQVVRNASLQPHRGDLTPALLEIALGREEPQNSIANFEQVRLWLYAHRRRSDYSARRNAFLALQRRVNGAGFDNVSGAFRHCPDIELASAPLLAEDQGRWLILLAGLAAADIDEYQWAREVASQTIDFVENELLISTGGFSYCASDSRIMTHSNAMLARGLIACGVVFDRVDWRSRGQTAVDFLLRYSWAAEAGFYRIWDGIPQTLGQLGDQVIAAQALLDGYELTGRASYLHHAQAVARLLEKKFRRSNGTLADIDKTNAMEGLLEESRFPLIENAEASELLIRLGHLTHDNRYVETAYSILEAVIGDFDAMDQENACALARVSDRLLSIEVEVKIIAVAPPGEVDSIADPLHKEALMLPLAASTIQRLNPDIDDDLVAQLGIPSQVAGAICCISGEYSRVLKHPDELLPAIEQALSTSV